MNTIRTLGILVLTVALPQGLEAAQQPAGTNHEKCWRGTVSAIDTRDNTIAVKRAWLTKKFNVGEHCAITAIGKKEAALTDLRPGERVRIRYQNAEGVLVADRIAERALHYRGTVSAIDQQNGTVTMEQAPLYRPFRAPERFHTAKDCEVTLWNGHAGTLAELHPGDRISVTYERPDGSPTAYRIEEKSRTLVGAVDAIDLSARTVKARQTLGETKFNLGDDCRIVVNGEKAGQLKDLALGRSYQFTYEQVNGVNVLERIAPAQAGKPAETASAR